MRLFGEFLMVAVVTTLVFIAGIVVGYKRPPERPVTPEDFTVHPVTCTYSPQTPSIVQCVGEVPIHLEGRRIRLISESWDGGAP